MKYIKKSNYEDTLENFIKANSDIIILLFNAIIYRDISSDLIDILPRNYTKDDGIKYEIESINIRDKYIKLPLWLVLKYPQLSEFAEDRCASQNYYYLVNTKKTVRDIDDLHEFLNALGSVMNAYMMRRNYFNESQDNLYTPPPTLDSKNYNPDIFDNLNFNPYLILRFPVINQYADHNDDRGMQLLTNWAEISEKNMNLYKKLIFYYNEAANSLKDYYENDNNLKVHASNIKTILLKYMCRSIIYADEYDNSYERDY